MPALNCSTLILIAATRIALEPSKRISRLKVAGVAIKTFPTLCRCRYQMAFAFYTDEVFERI